MTKSEIEKELRELTVRFKQLKKALQEQDELTPAQRMAAEIAERLTKGTPTKEQLLKRAKEVAEQQRAQQLANQLQKAGILGSGYVPKQPTTAEQEAWLRQNGMGQENMAKAEADWGNSINNWLAEATKPISTRFKSEAEERAYWDSIKINGGGSNEGPGY